MSFNSEYQKLRKKRKEQEQNKSVTNNTFNSYDNVFTMSKGKNSVVDIGPVKNTVTTIDDKKSSKDDTLDFFKKGALEEGTTTKNIGKAILGTLGDAGLGITKGLFSFGEGLSDAVGYAAAGVADLIGKKGWADDIRRTTQDSYTDDLFEVLSKKFEDESVLGRTSRGVMEGVGQAAGLVATAGLGGMAGLGVKGTTALTSAMTGLSGFGSGTSEAYQSGATDKEAVTYGMISAASDVLTEMLFGGLGKGANAIGLGKGLSSADDMLAKKVSNMFSNQIMKNFSEFGIKASAEGVEEVLAGVTQAFGKKLTYMSEEDISEILKDENLFEQFVVGSVTSGIMQAGDLHRANTHKTDFIDKELSQIEQAVFDKVYNDRLQEAKKDGKKISGKDKENIYNSVMNDIEKGYIGISDIESALGGETYKQYQSAVEKDNQMKELQKEYDSLYKMKNGEKSDEQIDRQKELKQQLDEYKSTSKLSAIHEQLSNEVSELAKTSKLNESYNEKSRKSQAFEADLTKYDAKTQETVKRAIDSGILNNTNRTHEFVDMIAKLSADKGVLFDFTNNEKIKASGFAIEGKQVNGYVQGNNIAINIDSTSALNKVVGHEITHILEGTELYTELADVVKQYATTKGEYDSKLQSITKLYEGIENANIENELTADLIGEYLFTDSNFINRLSAEKPTLFKKIFDEIKYLCKVATAGSKEARQLEKVKKTFEEAYRQKNNTATDDGVDSTNIKFSLELNNYPYNMQTVIKDYISSVDSELYDMVEKTKNEDKASFERHTIGEVSQNLIDDISSQLNIDVTNYSNAINSNAIQHIIKRHGENGEADSSMSNSNDIARMGYIVDNYDSFEILTDKDGNIEYSEEFRNADNSKAPMIKLSKKINGTYYVVEAVPESKYKKIWVVSAYINKSSGVTQAPNNSGSYLASPSSANNIISNSAENVKEKQLEIINKHNPAPNTYNTWVRTIDDIKTFEEALADDEIAEYDEFNPDFDRAMAEQAIKNGEITVYSSYPIKQGVFVSPSYMEAESYSGDGTVYSKRVPLDSVAWIDITQGQYADTKTDDTKMSLSNANDDLGPVRERNNVYGEDIRLQVDGPVREDIAPGEAITENSIINGDEPIKTTQSAETTKSSTHEDLVNQMSDIMDETDFNTNNEQNVNEDDLIIDEKAVARLTSKIIDGLDIGKTKKNKTTIGELVKFFGENYSATSKDDLYDAVKEKFGTVYVDSVIKNATDLIYDSVMEHREATSKVDKVTKNIESANISDKVKNEIKNQLTSAYEKIEAEFNIDKNNLINELNERRRRLENDTSNKNVFFQNHASELYSELKNLKKGVRASEDLTYFLDLGFNWNELKSTFLKVGKWPDTVLNSESEIEASVRDFLDQKYDDSVQELNDFDWTMEEEISNLESKAEEKRNNARLAVNGKLVKEIMDAEQVAMIGDTSLWKDKSKGFMYKTNTEHRNFRDIVKDKFGKTNIKLADALNDYFMGTYNHNEAELKREAAVIQKKFADLKLNKYEDVFVQMKGEFLHNPHTELTQHDIDTFMKLYGKQVDESKVDNAIDMARETYDSLIERMNEVLVAHGMKPIEYRRGYFPHFSEVEKTKWQKIAEKFLNWKTQNNDIPTDIAGMTESFKPNRSWQSFNKQRIGDETDYSFMKGFDGYLQGSLDWIYHIDDIMKRRVFENRIRYDHSDEGVKKQIQEIYKNNEFDTNAKQEQIDLVFREAENPLNNFIIDFRTRTNTLAGKKSSMDRGMEEFTSRKFYSTATNLNNRINANMVVGSVSSALTNFIPITQSWGEVSPVSSLKAMGDTIKSTFKDDGTINKSDFLTNRLNNVEKLYQTGWDKVINKAGWLMESIDSFTSQTVWRSKYLENISKGMSETEAIKNADQFAENVLAGRSRGNMPTIFDSKNPLIKMATAFQLEVNNQYGYMFKDMPQDMKNESVAKLAKGYATMFIGAYAYNALYSLLTGRDAAFDPIRIIQELIGDLTDDEEDEPADIIMDFTDNIIDELPFVGGVLGDGGRVPISSALPYDDGVRGAFEGTVTDLTEGDINNLTKEWLLSAGAYLLLPAGGGQIKKTAQGLSMFLDDDLPIAGSYTDSGKLRFIVEETMDEMIKAGLFGQYASKNARQYFDENRSPLSDKKTQELIDLDVSIEKYWEYQDGLKALGEHATLNEKGDYIANLEGFTVEQKNILINNIADRDEPIDLTGYENYSNFQEFDFATRYPEKYAVLQECGISVSEYKEKYEEKTIIYTDDFSWASNNSDKYTLSKAVTNDVTEYKKYTSDLSNIKSDKDKNGKSISGSAKRKKVAYINSLDIEKGAKLILYKSQYKSDDTYNTQIVEYLKGRKDITRAEKETILTELGFTVHKDGRVTW